MAEENPNGNGEGAKPQDPEPQGTPQDPKAGEGAKPQDPGAGEGNTVNRHKYDVDIANRERRIKKALADERVAGSLKALGCVNVKAARTV